MQSIVNPRPCGGAGLDRTFLRNDVQSFDIKPREFVGIRLRRKFVCSDFYKLSADWGEAVGPFFIQVEDRACAGLHEGVAFVSADTAPDRNLGRAAVRRLVRGGLS